MNTHVLIDQFDNKTPVRAAGSREHCEAHYKTGWIVCPVDWWIKNYNPSPGAIMAAQV